MRKKTSGKLREYFARSSICNMCFKTTEIKIDSNDLE